jgi:hypothetical protein
MSRTLSYADAVRLLGGTGSEIVDRLDRLLGGALLVLTGGGSELAVSLFDAKSELVGLSSRLLSSSSDRLSGLSRFDRSQRLAAAHAVLVLTAFFESVREADLPFRSRVLELHRGRQVGLATDSLPGRGLAELAGALLRNPDTPMLTPSVAGTVAEQQLRHFYRALSGELERYVSGLAVWDDLDDGDRRQTSRILRDLPAGAMHRYGMLLRGLAADFPEVAFWVDRADHDATRREVHTVATGLVEIERLLRAGGQAVASVRAALTRRYRAELARPILDLGEVPADLAIPTLEEGYIDPRFRAADVGAADRLDMEWFWDHQSAEEDFAGFLAAYLASSEAT